MPRWRSRMPAPTPPANSAVSRDWRAVGRRAAGPAIGLALVAGIFAAVIPRFADYQAVWQAMIHLSGRDWAVIAVCTVAQRGHRRPAVDGGRTRPWLPALDAAHPDVGPHDDGTADGRGGRVRDPGRDAAPLALPAGGRHGGIRPRRRVEPGREHRDPRRRGRSPRRRHTSPALLVGQPRRGGRPRRHDRRRGDHVPKRRSGPPHRRVRGRGPPRGRWQSSTGPRAPAGASISRACARRRSASSPGTGRS